MTRQNVLDYCLSLDGAYAKHPFGPSPTVLAVGERGFCDFYEESDPLHIVVKCDPTEALFLRDLFPCVKPGYHTNKTHWISVYLDGTLDDGELKRMLLNSYKLVSGRKREILPFGVR